MFQNRGLLNKREHRNVLCSVCSVRSLWPHGLQPARLLCPWGSPGKNAGVGCYSFSRRSSQPRDWPHISCVSPALAGRFFTTVSSGSKICVFWITGNIWLTSPKFKTSWSSCPAGWNVGVMAGVPATILEQEDKNHTASWGGRAVGWKESIL